LVLVSRETRHLKLPRSLFRRDWPGWPSWQAAALFALAVATFLPALANGFVWDDLNNLVLSDRLRHWSALGEVFRQPAMWSAGLPVGHVGTYRPLALASFVIDHKLGGGHAWLFHLSSVLLHGLTAVMLFRVLARLLPLGARPPNTRPDPAVDRRAAWALAAIWAVHPAAVEAVAWINGRSELFALLFGLVALLLALPPKGGPPGDWRRLGVFAALLLAALGKETGLMFVPLMLWLVALRGDASLPPWRRIPGGMWLTAGAAIAAYLGMRSHALARASLPAALDLPRAIAGIPALWMRALQAAVLPLERAPITVGRWIRGLSWWEMAAYLLVCLVLAAAAVWLWRRGRRLVGVGLAWWALALLPAALVVVSTWPGLMRWLYLALPGLLLATHQLLAGRLRGRIGIGVAAALILAGVALTQRALPVWRHDAVLFATLIDESPDDPFGYQTLGATMVRARNFPAAAALFDRARSLGARGRDVDNYLALCWAEMGRCQDARRLYRPFAGSLVPPDLFKQALDRCLLAHPAP
jgi:protein O-mannosyl-transferase